MSTSSSSSSSSSSCSSSRPPSYTSDSGTPSVNHVTVNVTPLPPAYTVNMTSTYQPPSNTTAPQTTRAKPTVPVPVPPTTTTPSKRATRNACIIISILACLYPFYLLFLVLNGLGLLGGVRAIYCDVTARGCPDKNGTMSGNGMEIWRNGTAIGNENDTGIWNETGTVTLKRRQSMPVTLHGGPRPFTPGVSVSMLPLPGTPLPGTPLPGVPVPGIPIPNKKRNEKDQGTLNRNETVTRKRRQVMPSSGPVTVSVHHGPTQSGVPGIPLPVLPMPGLPLPSAPLPGTSVSNEKRNGHVFGDKTTLTTLTTFATPTN